MQSATLSPFIPLRMKQNETTRPPVESTRGPRLEIFVEFSLRPEGNIELGRVADADKMPRIRPRYLNLLNNSLKKIQMPLSGWLICSPRLVAPFHSAEVDVQCDVAGPDISFSFRGIKKRLVDDHFFISISSHLS